MVRGSYYYTVRSDDVKVLKSRWNFAKTKTKTPVTIFYTLLITFIAFSSFVSSKFYFPYKLTYYACATSKYWSQLSQSRERTQKTTSKHALQLFKKRHNKPIEYIETTIFAFKMSMGFERRSDLATQRERQLTTARANWEPEVTFSPFHALSRRQLTFLFCC